MSDIFSGAAHAFNSAGEWGEKKLQQGKKKLGQAVHAGTEAAGDVLDAAGAHGAADAVEDWGDKAASALGAHVGERQLGETEEADELVHGNAKKINATAKHLRAFHSAFDGIHGNLQRIRATDWKGEGADAFTTKFVEHPQQWAHAADACEAAAGALEAYAHTVEWAQKQAEEAVRLYKKGKEAEKKAVDAYNAKVVVYNLTLEKGKDPGPKPDKPGKAGEADVHEARRILAEARKQRDTAAGEARSKVAAAVAHAPAKPSFSDRMKGDALDLADGGSLELLHAAGGGIRAATDMEKFARSMNPSDPYNMTHPADYLGGVNNSVAGMLSLASHPERVPTALLGTGWGSDPSEAAGKLAGTVLLAVATGGAGAGAASAAERGAISAAKKGAEDLAESAARRELKAHPNEPNTPPGGETTGHTDPVDLATGRMFLPQTDVTLAGALPMTFQRRVKSGYQCGRWFGTSWSSTVDQRLEIGAEGVIFVDEHGRLLEYPHPAPGVPTFPARGPRWQLDTALDGGYTITDASAGYVRHFAPYTTSATALLEQITDRRGHYITFEYEADGTPTVITHSCGYRLRITTDRGRITALHLACESGEETELVRYGYTNSNLTEVYNSSGQPLRFTYDERGRVTSWMDRNDCSYTYIYDNQDRCIHESGIKGHMRCSLEYGAPDPDTGESITKVTNSLGKTTTYTFSSRGQLIRETSPLGSTTQSVWDRYDRPVSRTDSLGRTTEFCHDTDGRLTEITRPDGQKLTASYNPLGLPETITGPGGSIWHQTYDEKGNRTSVTDPSGAETRYTYDEHGHPASVTDALGNTTHIKCDRAGLPIEITNPLGGITTYRRDAFSRITAIVDPIGSTTRLSWTIEGQLARRVAADGFEQSWTYDGEGNCITYTNPLGHMMRYEYTDFDLLAAQVSPSGVRQEFSYDTQLQLREVNNATGLKWNYDYDADGHLISETDFDGRTLTYKYDCAGQLTARTNALHQRITYDHDALGRVVTKNADGQVTTYAYDAAGRLLEASTPDATLIYGRDRLGRIKSESTNGRTLTFSYDSIGRRVHRTTPNGATSSWHYDSAGRRSSINISGKVFDLTHDAAGREVVRRFGDNITLTHSWDVVGRLTGQCLTTDADRPLIQRTYDYRGDGYLSSITDADSGTRTFVLDPAGRVTTVNAPDWTEHYAYDGAGNQTQASWPDSHPGTEAHGRRTYVGTRLVQAGKIRYEYDAQGRVVLRQKARLSRKPDTWHYEWDAEDRLTAVTTPDGTRWRYFYDAFGRRMSKQRLTSSGEVAEQTDFTWHGSTLIEQTSTSVDLPNPIALTWDHDDLRPISQTERILAADGSQQVIDRRFFAIITDIVGTPSELIDESGAKAWYTRATLWGTTAWSADSTTYTPLRFPGQHFDPETGLHYNFRRYYDPETARYTSPDPLGLTPAPNPVTYVHNPHRWVDPRGLAPCKVAPSSSSRDLRQTGGSSFRRPRNEVDFETDWADHAYEKIRSDPQLDQVTQTAEPHGFSRQDIEQIHNHLFIEEHELDAGFMRFDANPRIARAWERLQNGETHPTDIELLRHELYESSWMRDNGSHHYVSAHQAALDAGFTWDEFGPEADGIPYR